MSVRVRIGGGCTGMGSCTRLAPAVFRIDPASGRAQVMLDDCSLHREAVLTAANACPFVLVEIDGVPASEPIDPATVLAAERLTPDIIALRLRLRRPGYRFTPGQYAFLRLNDEQGEFFRTYSIVSAERDVVTMCVRLVPNGRAGRILGTITPGTEVGLSQAKGLFALESADRPKLFITGGTGLAPVLPMCRAAPTARKLVVVGARSSGDLFWRDELRALPNTEIIEIVQNPDPSWTGRVGLVTAPLEGIDPSLWQEIYTCGSPGMVEAVRKTLNARGIPTGRIRSDSFLAAGTAPASVSGPQVILKPQFDWPGLLRRVHYISSAPLALVILFYAVTGFIANRSSLFEGEGTAKSEHSVPAGVALDREHLAPVLLAMLPSGAVLDGFTAGADPKAECRCPDRRAWTLAVNATSRSVRIEEHGVLPAATAAEPAAVARTLAGRLSGQPDLEHASTGDGEIELEFASVWGTHQVKVDTAERTWTATTTHPPLVVSLVDLHRGKHAGAWQRVVIDVTALVLAFITLSGCAMALIAAPARRRKAMLLLAVSALVLTSLILAR